jgi:hypothetical protein
MAIKLPKREQLKPIVKRYGLRLIALFGSQVTDHNYIARRVRESCCTSRFATSAQELFKICGCD